MGLLRYESVCSYTFLHMTAVSLLVSIDSVPTGITSKSFLDEKTFIRDYDNSSLSPCCITAGFLMFFDGIQTVRASIQEYQQPSRSEPSSRTFLIGEQPNAWDLLQPRAKVSRHRGAELRRRYGRLGGTSLLSPG